MLKAIVFDFDGVIVDSEPLHHRAFNEVMHSLGVDFSYQQYLERYVGYDDRDGFRALLADFPHSSVGDDQAQFAQLCDQKATAFKSIVEKGFDTIPGVLGFIDKLPDDLPTAIASGATQHDIDLILTKLRLDHRFNPIVAADDTIQSKPHPQTYTLAVERLIERCPQMAIEPAHCLAIEDTPAGIESAKQAGLMTLALSTTCLPQHLHYADRLIPSFEGLTLKQLRAWYD